MRSILFLSFLLNFLFLKTIAQNSSVSTTQAPATTTFVSLTPEMSANSVSSVFSALASSDPLQAGSPEPGDAGSSPTSGDSTAGASGPDSGSITLSKGGLIAIIIVVVVISVFGIASSVLWYIAKKRSWEVRKTIRKSARKVVTALTPRRSTFPKDVHGQRSSKGLTRIEEVPPTPKFYGDVEKANPKISSFELSQPPKESKWAKKLGR
ncbi:hypothetical protein B7494_g5688 [Chlorociboria aeruginascens]|nr:hypothetical protein B7494_g5688 [Chlorociboria aeruginascens]